MEMESIGQSNSIYIYTKKEVWGSFTVVQKTNLDKQSAPCVMDPNYSYTRCMLNHLATTAGCYLDWVNPGAVNLSNPWRFECVWYQVFKLMITELAWHGTRFSDTMKPWTQLENSPGLRWSMLQAALPSAATESSSLKRLEDNIIRPLLAYITSSILCI